MNLWILNLYANHRGTDVVYIGPTALDQSTRVSQMKTVNIFFKFNLLNESGTQLYHFST
jgi:hypothetical protein